jgi:hypothetical protein
MRGGFQLADPARGQWRPREAGRVFAPGGAGDASIELWRARAGPPPGTGRARRGFGTVNLYEIARVWSHNRWQADREPMARLALYDSKQREYRGLLTFLYHRI